ncbi:hypothetical protein GCM10028805_36420 [Spirosoma harenae]
MTQNERAQVWARKDQLTKALNELSDTDNRSKGHIKEEIESCNQALVHDNFELMAHDEE